MQEMPLPRSVPVPVNNIVLGSSTKGDTKAAILGDRFRPCELQIAGNLTGSSVNARLGKKGLEPKEGNPSQNTEERENKYDL
jgi:hypothetical protein